MDDGYPGFLFCFSFFFFVASGASVIPPLLCLAATCEATLLRHSPMQTGTVFVLVGGSSVALPSGQTEFVRSRAANLLRP